MRTELIEQANTCMCNTYSRHDLLLVRGKGCRLWDADGREFLDFVSGIAVCNLGHAPPELAEVMSRQAEKLVHVSNLYYTEPQIHLARELVATCFADRVFFCNSGAEANEAAIKLARKYSLEQHGPGRTEIITARNSFHGRTMATLSATGQEKVHKGFEPLVPGFRYVDFNDLGAIAAAIDDKVCAVLLEPIQGEGGVRVPDPGYLAGVRRLCDEHGLLLIFDEIQVGMGRTGKLYCHQHEEVHPHIMTLAKALANGLPIGAMLCTEEVGAAFGPGSHGSTFGGTPLVCSVALAVLEKIRTPEFLHRVAEMGAYLRRGLEDLQQRHGCIKEVRGRGLLLGLELDRPGKEVVARCQEMGILINCTADTVLRFLPPLVVTTEEADQLLQVMEKVLRAI